MSDTPPSLNGANGRGTGGHFGKGNPGGRGNPMARHVNKLRVALLRAVKPKDMKIIVEKLVELAKGGDLGAIRELFSRAVGNPIEHDLLQRIEDLEAKDRQP